MKSKRVFIGIMLAVFLLGLADAPGQAKEPQQPGLLGDTGAWDEALLRTDDQLVQPSTPLASATQIVSWEYDQIRPGIAYSSQSDRYLVVWEDHHWGFGDDWDIYGRYIGSNGVPLGSHFSISWEGNQHRLVPAVVNNSTSGEFLVVWEYEFSSTDHDIYAQRVSSDGNLIGSEILITNLTNFESNPAVAYNSINNEYLIVWEHLIEGHRHGIYGRRIAANGMPLGEIIFIDTSSPWIATFLADYDALAPAVAYSPLANQYMVVWQDKYPEKIDYDITGRWVGNDGSLMEGEIPISTWEYDQVKPHLAFNSTLGEFLVVWEDHHWGWGDDWDIYGQRVKPDGTLVGSNFSVSWDGASHRERPAVAFHPAINEYLVTWEYEFSPGNHDIYYRRVASDGTLPEGEAVISSLGSWEGRPYLAADNSDAYFIAWEDGRNSETLGLDIYGNTVRLFNFSGKVFAGDLGDESAPLSGATVELYCSSAADDLGSLIASTLTNIDGWYTLQVASVCEFYNLVETDLIGYVSIGAISVDGSIIDENWIQYMQPLEGKMLTGNKFWDLERDIPVSDIPTDFHRRAAQLLEEVRGSEMAPGWEQARLSTIVRPLYRPDVEGVAYYEFQVVVQSQPAGFIILSTGEHDFPIPHWNFTGESPTQILIHKANQDGKNAARFYKLDALAYAAQDGQGNLAAISETQPVKVSGMDPAWLDQPIELTEVLWMPDPTQDDADTPSDGVLTTTGPVSSTLQLSGWESWGELKAGYTPSYGVLIEGLRREAQEEWEGENLIEQYGVVLHKGDVYTLAMLCENPLLSLSGSGIPFIQTELVARDGLLPVYKITVTNSLLGEALPVDVTMNCSGSPVETVKFLIWEPYTVQLPLVTRNAGGQAAQQVQKPQNVRGDWGPWTMYWAWAGFNDQRMYYQIPAGSPPNTSGCPSGCGATAWAMLFGWADFEASNKSWNYWQPRWGIYRENGGYGLNAVAPKYMDDGIRNITWEIRNRIGTWCVFGSAPTPPWQMSGAFNYLKGRTGTQLYTKYSVVGIPWSGIREYARDTIYYHKTPVIIGTGWLSHYPLAYGYAWQAKKVWWGTKHNRWFWVNQGWGGSGDGWVSASTWFAGAIYP